MVEAPEGVKRRVESAGESELIRYAQSGTPEEQAVAKTKIAVIRATGSPYFGFGLTPEEERARTQELHRLETTGRYPTEVTTPTYTYVEGKPLELTHAVQYPSGKIVAPTVIYGEVEPEIYIERPLTQQEIAQQYLLGKPTAQQQFQMLISPPTIPEPIYPVATHIETGMPIWTTPSGMMYEATEVTPKGEIVLQQIVTPTPTMPKTQLAFEFWKQYIPTEYVPAMEYGASMITSTPYPIYPLKGIPRMEDVWLVKAQKTATEFLKPVSLEQEHEYLKLIGITPSPLTNIGYAAREFTKGMVVGTVMAVPSTLAFGLEAIKTVPEMVVKKDITLPFKKISAGISAAVASIQAQPAYAGGAVVGATLFWKGVGEVMGYWKRRESLAELKSREQFYYGIKDLERKAYQPRYLESYGVESKITGRVPTERPLVKGWTFKEPKIGKVDIFAQREILIYDKASREALTKIGQRVIVTEKGVFPIDVAPDELSILWHGKKEMIRFPEKYPTIPQEVYFRGMPKKVWVEPTMGTPIEEVMVQRAYVSQQFAKLRGAWMKEYMELIKKTPSPKAIDVTEYAVYVAKPPEVKPVYVWAKTPAPITPLSETFPTTKIKILEGIRGLERPVIIKPTAPTKLVPVPAEVIKVVEKPPVIPFEKLKISVGKIPSVTGFEAIGGVIGGIPTTQKLEAKYKITPMERVIPISQPKIEYKLMPKFQPKIEPMLIPRLQPRLEPKLELQPKVQPKIMPRLEPKLQPKLEPKLETRIEPRLQPRLQPKLMVKPKVIPTPTPTIEPIIPKISVRKPSRYKKPKMVRFYPHGKRRRRYGLIPRAGLLSLGREMAKSIQKGKWKIPKHPKPTKKVKKKFKLDLLRKFGGMEFPTAKMLKRGKELKFGFGRPSIKQVTVKPNIKSIIPKRRKRR